MPSDPLPIEINYDPERELFGDESEAPDARHLLVEIEKRKLKAGTLKLAAPDDTPDAVVPIRIRVGTQIARGNGVEFRAELDVDAIYLEWDSVEDAAREEHAIIISVEEDTPPGRPKWGTASTTCRGSTNARVEALWYRHPISSGGRDATNGSTWIRM